MVHVLIVLSLATHNGSTSCYLQVAIRQKTSQLSGMMFRASIALTQLFYSACLFLYISVNQTAQFSSPSTKLSCVMVKGDLQQTCASSEKSVSSFQVSFQRLFQRTFYLLCLQDAYPYTVNTRI